MPRRPAPPIVPLAPTAPRRRPGGGELASGRPEPSPPAPEPRPRRRPVPSASSNPRPTGRRRPRPEPLAAVLQRSSGGSPTGVAPAALRSDRPHPLTDTAANGALLAYDEQVKGSFDRIVPVLRKLSALQHEEDFLARAQRLALAELGTELPLPILETAWVTQLDMRTLFAWCVFQAYEQTSSSFFQDDPLAGGPGSARAREFEEFLLGCGFHLLDITPCADGRLAHAIAYALRLPFSSVRRRPHAGALFDVENTVNRWVKTEHRRYREGVPNPAHADTRYLKVVLYHFSSLDPSHEGCAAHGSDDAAAARRGQERLGDFRMAVENSFCCGASVDLLLMGLDTDTDAIRVHVPGLDGSINLERWLDARDVYEATRSLSTQEGRLRIQALVEQAAAASPDPGLVRLIARLLEHNLSQIDLVRQAHGGHYADAGHAERFIGVGIGFKEIHLRNLTYFAYMDTVEEGAADLDVGVKIFSGLNGSRGLPIPVVVRFDYNGAVPGARERAIRHGERVVEALKNRYHELFSQGLLHALLTVRETGRHTAAETIASTIVFASAGGH